MPLVGYDNRVSTEVAIQVVEDREEPQDAASGRPECSGRAKCSELTPAQLQLRAMVLASVISPHSRRNYAKALDLLFAFADGRPLTRALLMEYRSSLEDLAPSTVNVRLAAVRKLVTEARANGMLSAEEAAHLTEFPTSGRGEPDSATGSPRSRRGSCCKYLIAKRLKANATTRSSPSWSGAPCGEGNWPSYI